MVLEDLLTLALVMMMMMMVTVVMVVVLAAQRSLLAISRGKSTTNDNLAA